MARLELAEIGNGLGGAQLTGETFYKLGMMYSAGSGVPVDLVAAHKWFNLAAVRGNADASRLRREVADQMSDAEIALAQRQARAWLTSH